jgi:hypothetical protein
MFACTSDFKRCNEFKIGALMCAKFQPFVMKRVFKHLIAALLLAAPQSRQMHRPSSTTTMIICVCVWENRLPERNAAVSCHCRFPDRSCVQLQNKARDPRRIVRFSGGDKGNRFRRNDPENNPRSIGSGKQSAA